VSANTTCSFVQIIAIYTLVFHVLLDSRHTFHPILVVLLKDEEIGIIVKWAITELININYQYIIIAKSINGTIVNTLWMIPFLFIIC
jgi:hypothetical protein